MLSRSVAECPWGVLMVLHSPWPSPCMSTALTPYFLMDAFQLAGNNVAGLIPGNSLVFAFAAILGIAFAIGVPVNSLKRELNSVGGIDPLFVRQRKGTGERLPGGFYGLSIPFNLPLAHIIFAVFPSVAQRPYAHDFSIFDIHHPLGAPAEKTAQSQTSQYCLVLGLDVRHRSIASIHIPRGRH